MTESKSTVKTKMNLKPMILICIVAASIGALLPQAFAAEPYKGGVQKVDEAEGNDELNEMIQSGYLEWLEQCGAETAH